eukprot:TRINITY_DN12230_c0_g1_i4.p1 TRINITY_DN12230_c0_g1~~TRINITY_DN12230_c0_g1_i4.p1  ORF type:complete len:847 (-),score=179.11 TRINITY_DN12230_c0_g1_i4:67-2607(-)
MSGPVRRSSVTACFEQSLCRQAIPKPQNEQQRLHTLHKLNLMDTQSQSDEIYNDVVTSLTQICSAPMATFSLVDKDRLWVKAEHGTGFTQVDRDISFCTHTIMKNDIMEVPDALLDPRFAHNPAVVGSPHIRFYAGAPLIVKKRDGDEHCVGVLCVLDTVPRRLDTAQRAGLQSMTRLISAQIEARRKAQRLEKTMKRLDEIADDNNSLQNYTEHLETQNEELIEKVQNLMEREDDPSSQALSVPAEEVITLLSQLKSIITSFTEHVEHTPRSHHPSHPHPSRHIHSLASIGRPRSDTNISYRHSLGLPRTSPLAHQLDVTPGSASLPASPSTSHPLSHGETAAASAAKECTHGSSDPSWCPTCVRHQTIRDIEYISEIVASHRLYTPDLPHLLQNNMEIDRQTKRFLMTQLGEKGTGNDIITETSPNSSPTHTTSAPPSTFSKKPILPLRLSSSASSNNIGGSASSARLYQPANPLQSSRSSGSVNKLIALQGGPTPLMRSSSVSSALNTFSQKKARVHVDHNAMQSLFAEMTAWDFNVFAAQKKTGGHALVYGALSAFHQHNLIEKFKLDKDKLENFLVAIENGYLENPYHNSTHAADVLIGCNFFMHHAPQWKEVDPIEKLATIIAAAIHDYGHPGVNNAFLVNTGHELAVRHNDQSVLENHHCAEAFMVLQRPECNFLAEFSAPDMQRLRKMIIDMVLATDMARHLEIVAQFQNRLSTGGLDLSTKEDRSLLQRMTIKCSDISNPAKPILVYDRWVENVLEEFYSQGDIEKSLKMPVTAFMDRTRPTPAKCQIGFINFIVLPTFKLWTGYVQTPEVLKTLEDNLERWKAIEEQERAAGIATA